MTIAFVADADASHAGSGTLTVPVPTGTQAGDTVVVAMLENALSGEAAPTSDDGFYLEGEVSYGRWGQLWSFQVPSPPPASYTWTVHTDTVAVAGTYRTLLTPLLAGDGAVNGGFDTTKIQVGAVVAGSTYAETGALIGAGFLVPTLGEAITGADSPLTFRRHLAALSVDVALGDDLAVDLSVAVTAAEYLTLSADAVGDSRQALSAVFRPAPPPVSGWTVGYLPIT